VWIALPGVVRGNDRRRRRQDLIEPIEEESVNDGQMAGVLVSGPLVGRRTALERGSWNLANEGHDHARGSLECRDDSSCSFHVLNSPGRQESDDHGSAEATGGPPLYRTLRDTRVEHWQGTGRERLGHSDLARRARAAQEPSRWPGQTPRDAPGARGPGRGPEFHAGRPPENRR